jgi:hypothetical protein
VAVVGRWLGAGLLLFVFGGQTWAQREPREVFTGSCPEPSSAYFTNVSNKSEIVLEGETTPVRVLDDVVTFPNGLFKGWVRRILKVKVTQVHKAPGPIPGELFYVAQYYSEGARAEPAPFAMLGYNLSLLALNRSANAAAPYVLESEFACHSTQGTRRH